MLRLDSTHLGGFLSLSFAECMARFSKKTYGWLTNSSKAHVTQYYLQKILLLSNFLRSLFRAGHMVSPEMNFTLEIMVWKMYISPPASKNCYFLVSIPQICGGVPNDPRSLPSFGKSFGKAKSWFPISTPIHPRRFRILEKKHTKNQQFLGCCYEFLTSHRSWPLRQSCASGRYYDHPRNRYIAPLDPGESGGHPIKTKQRCFAAVPFQPFQTSFRKELKKNQ